MIHPYRCTQKYIEHAIVGLGLKLRGCLGRVSCAICSTTTSLFQGKCYLTVLRARNAISILP